MRIYLPAIAVLFAILACGLPAANPTIDPNAVNTIIAQTVIAAITQSASAVILPPTAETSTPTFTLDLPTPALSETPTVFTPIPLVPQISVSVPTNCRFGPGKAYEIEGSLLVGETAEVLARDPTGSYWYIRNPDSGAEFCWVWGAYATLSGNTAFLPMFTPQPTPTSAPDFEASYSDLDACVGWWVEIKLKNTGSLTFRSLSLAVRDTVTSTVLLNDTDDFTNLDGCVSSKAKKALLPGVSTIISAPPFAYDPTGHKIRVTITLCSEDAQQGSCLTKVINFTP